MTWWSVVLLSSKKHLETPHKLKRLHEIDAIITLALRCFWKIRTRAFTPFYADAIEPIVGVWFGRAAVHTQGVGLQGMRRDVQNSRELK